MRGFDAACPLDDAELEALPHLIAARAAIVAVGTEQQALLEPHNDYAQRVRAGDWAICETAAAHAGRARRGGLPARLRAQRGRARAARARRGLAAAGHRAGGARPISRPTGARPAHAARRDRRPRRGALARDARALERRARDDPPRPRPLRPRAAARCARRWRVASSAPKRARARAGGRRARAAPGRARARAWRPASHRGGRRCSGHLTRAARCRRTCTCRSRRRGSQSSRALPRRPSRQAWLALCPHPGPLLGLACRRSGAERALLARRRAVIPQAQPLYYAEPPEIVRGRRQHLYDAHGRAYLDCVNNVAVRRPQPPARDEAAATRQLRLLNTNSRFLYESMTRFAERLAALLPDAARARVPRLDGLGGQRPRAAPGARGDRAGATCSASATPTTAGRPRPTRSRRAPSTTRWARCRRPTRAPGDLARHLPRPDRRGDAMPGARYAERRADAIVASWRPRGRAPAAFICEALYGNAGGIVLPDGYLQAAYAHVRAAGGVCIADEVQVGYGRLGAHFWGFEQQGVVPDIVTIAKATGNGHPVGGGDHDAARSPTRSRGQGGFFASVGGGAGLVRDRPGGARRDRGGAAAGERPARGRRAARGARASWSAGHEIAGAAHGMGLYLGLDLVRDRETQGAGARGGLRDLRAAARARRDRAADRRRRERAEAQAAARDRGCATWTGCSRRSTRCWRAAGRKRRRALCNRLAS